MTYKFRNIQK